ncbi:hypothetical protein AX16_001967 [Volvariella volvacea WC 439]|nr:hypothetical protein AX16_001967 [Volvariella volvacea WC 439]
MTAKSLYGTLGLASLVFPHVVAYWLIGANNVLTTQRVDPIVQPGVVSTHVHSVLGGSNFGLNLSTQSLRDSECTSVPIVEDNSNYWYPVRMLIWRNDSFSSVDGSAVIDETGKTTAFPDDVSDPELRTFNSSSYAQQAVSFLCLNFESTSTRHNELPVASCPSGIRSQINFPSCWDGINVDSENHKSHVAFPSDGPDQGTCNSINYPFTIPRIFLEVYWGTQVFDSVRHEAMNPEQPFVFSNGDPTGYSFHADFYNGWDKGVLQEAVGKCHCDPFGDPTCCVAGGLFTMRHPHQCYITPMFDEQTLGLLSSLPGPNPVRADESCEEREVEIITPASMSPVWVYTGTNPPPTATQISPASTGTVTQLPAAHCTVDAGGPSSVNSANSQYLGRMNMMVVIFAIFTFM